MTIKQSLLISPNTIDSLNKEAYDSIDTEPDKARRLLEENILSAKKLDYKFGLAKSIQHLAWLRISRYELPEAFEALIEAQELFAEIHEEFEVGICWNYQAWIYFYLGDHENRLECNLNYIKVLNPGMHRDLYISAISNIGDNYVKLGKIEQALETFNACLEMQNLSNDVLGPLSNNLGEAYFFKGDYETAEKWFLDAIKYLEEVDNSRFLGYTRTYLAELYHIIGKPEKVLALLEHARETVLEHNQKRLSALVQKIYSKYFEKDGKAELALKHYKEYVKLTEAYKSEAHSARLKTVMFNRQLVHIQKEKNIINQKNEELQAANEIIQLQAETLQDVNAQLKSFAYNASHDLREPLRTMSNFSKLLKNNALERLDSNELEYLDFITSSSKRMDKMVNDLLEYATLPKAVDKDQTIDVNKIIENIKSDFELKLGEVNGTIVYNKLPLIVSNHTMVKQLFQNIIANALKFKKKDSPPYIEVECIDLGDKYRFTIKDNGIGIKQENIEKIFEVFTRLNNSSEFAGSGIGLATCKKIAEELNTELLVDSTYGKGTVFSFSLEKSL